MSAGAGAGPGAALNGPPARSDGNAGDAVTLEAVLGAVSGRVGYLRALPAPPEGEGWVGAGDLGARHVEAAVAARPGVDPQVAASLFAQSYAFRVGSVSLAAYALGLPWPAPDAGNVSVLLAGGRATNLAFRGGALAGPGGERDLAAALLAGHLGAFTGVVREAVRVGTRLLWGNVASSVAAAFRAVEGAARDRGDAAERAGVRRRAGAFLAAAEPWLGGAGRFETVAGAGGDGWYWTRTSCCLWYRVPGASRCDDCSLFPAAELRARRLGELAGAAR